MEGLPTILLSALGEVGNTLGRNWPILALSAAVAAALKLYADPAKVSAFLQKKKNAGIAGATLAAVTTPFCSCGTTAVVLGMMASMLPWAPIVAFMVASPLTSPQELLYSAGIFGWPFALTFFLSSIALGLAGGYLAAFAEKRGWLKDQARMRTKPAAATEASREGGRPKAKEIVVEFLASILRLLIFFIPFAFVGYALNALIPHEWVTNLFGRGRTLGVPLAATIGVPLYINTDASLPLVRSFMDMGMSPGATLAFLITGAGTSFGAIGGAFTIARWRVIAIVVGTLWVGAILLGFATDAFLVI